MPIALFFVEHGLEVDKIHEDGRTSLQKRNWK